MEYAVLIAAICAAVIAMQFYMKRGVSGRLKQGADEVGQQFDYNKTVSLINTTVKIDSNINATMVPGVIGTDSQGYPIYALEYAINQTQNITRQGSESVTK
jgi:hypothetical protein